MQRLLKFIATAEGVPLGSVVAFLTAAQSSGLDSAAITYGLLGWRAALARLRDRVSEREAVEGKEVPDEAVLNMKSNFVLPEIEEQFFSEVS